jgi:hypothetical protein
MTSRSAVRFSFILVLAFVGAAAIGVYLNQLTFGAKTTKAVSHAGKPDDVTSVFSHNVIVHWKGETGQTLTSTTYSGADMPVCTMAGAAVLRACAGDRMSVSKDGRERGISACMRSIAEYNVATEGAGGSGVGYWSTGYWSTANPTVSVTSASGGVQTGPIAVERPRRRRSRTRVDTPVLGSMLMDLPSSVVPTSRAQLLEYLRSVEPGTLARVGYDGDDGMTHALSQKDLEAPTCSIRLRRPDGDHVIVEQAGAAADDWLPVFSLWLARDTDVLADAPACVSGGVRLGPATTMPIVYAPSALQFAPSMAKP